LKPSLEIPEQTLLATVTGAAIKGNLLFVLSEEQTYEMFRHEANAPVQ
jgi:hypothetical protein